MIWDNNEDIKKIECRNNASQVQQLLNENRELRSPYVFLLDTMREIEALHRILVPVTMLQEEVYKAEICSYLCRKTDAQIIILQPNDYGNKAKINIGKITTLLDKFSLPYRIEQGKKNTFSLYKEACQRADEFQADLLLLTASREYGWDDLIFGPVERYVIQHAKVPVMLVNPRADLFSLCD